MNTHISNYALQSVSDKGKTQGDLGFKKVLKIKKWKTQKMLQYM